MKEKSILENDQSNDRTESENDQIEDNIELMGKEEKQPIHSLMNKPNIVIDNEITTSLNNSVTEIKPVQ
jgi:hypothetical protein